MEFFVKAHVPKKKPTKKEGRTEKIAKEQLKQLLHGYKHGDNKLIKSVGDASENLVRKCEEQLALDESASVDGYSDLDVTKSEDEVDNSQDISFECSDDDVSNSSPINPNIAYSMEQSDQTETSDDTDKSEQDLLDHTEDNLESVPDEEEEYFYSLPEDLELTECSAGRETSLSESAESSSSLSSNSEEEIVMRNLNKAKQNDRPVNKKQKLNDMPIPKKEKCLVKNSKSKKSRNNKNKSDGIDIENLSISDNDEHLHTQDSVSTNESLPFISITATDMSEESLNDILGEYKHPTIRNSSYEKQNPVANSTSIFTIDDSLKMNDDINRLIPEIRDDLTMDDTDIELDTAADSKELNSIEFSDAEEHIVESPSTCIKSVKVYYADTCCIFVLKHPANLYINGQVKIKPLAGQVEIFGHVLKKEVNIYSPNNSFAQCVKTQEADNNYYGLFGRLTKSGLIVSEAEEIVTTLGEYDAVIAIKPLKDVKMEFVDNHFPADVFMKLKVDSNAVRLAKASEILGCNLYTSKPLRVFESCIAWDDNLKGAMNKPSRGIICGGKNLGKSTLIRYYINNMLSNGPVLLIDLDPGQAEFTVAGSISATVVSTPLLGPNFTHLKTPDISYNIGMINVMDNAFRYVSTVATLIEQCNARYDSMPWIVNTMGMTNHIGLKLIVLTIIHTQPTLLIQIDSKVPRKHFETTLEPQAVCTIYENCRYDRLLRGVELPEGLNYKFVITSHNEGSYKQDTSLSSKEERYLNFLAYFGELLVIHKVQNILGIVPYEVKLCNVNILTNVKVAEDSILNVINGKIVALCELATEDKGRVMTLQDDAPMCHGYGVIRSIDIENKLVYVLTPVAPEHLSSVNAFVYSDWVPELQSTHQMLPAGVPVPYHAATHHRNKQHMIAPRRRFNPLQLLKMSRSS